MTTAVTYPDIELEVTYDFEFEYETTQIGDLNYAHLTADETTFRVTAISIETVELVNHKNGKRLDMTGFVDIAWIESEIQEAIYESRMAV